MALRARRGSVAVAAAIGALAAVAPSASAAADATPPTAPPKASTVLDVRCTGARYVGWAGSTDNVDSHTDLRYRFYNAQGQAIEFGHWGFNVPADPGAAGNGSLTWIGVGQVPATVRAVDRAGNLSAPTAVKDEGVV